MEIHKLGKIIQNVRLHKGISLEELSCKEYSIDFLEKLEKGELNSSIVLLKYLSFHLNIDFIELLPYLECDAPVKIHELMQKIEKSRQDSDIESLKTLTEEALKLEDFHSSPWDQEIIYNNIFCNIIGKKDLNKTYDLLKDAIESSDANFVIFEENLKTASSILIRFYNMLALYYLLVGDYKTSLGYFKYIYDGLFIKKMSNEFQNIYISVTLNYLNSLLLDKQYINTIVIGEELIEFQRQNMLLYRIHITNFILSVCNYRLSNFERTDEYIRKSMYMGLVLEKKEDFEFLLKNNVVKEMENKGVLNVNLRNQFKTAYGI